MAWHNTRRIFPTAQVSRGNGPVAALARADRDLTKITFTDPATRKSVTVAEMLDATYTTVSWCCIMARFSPRATATV